MDDGIRERHGMSVVNDLEHRAPVWLDEQDSRIRLIECRHDRFMTPDQARYLARQLYRLARRIESREQPS
jgi:hypothetical protein